MESFFYLRYIQLLVMWGLPLYTIGCFALGPICKGMKLSRGCTGIQQRGDDDYNKQGILMDDKRRLHRNTGKNIQTALTHDINNNPQVTLGRTDLYRET